MVIKISDDRSIEDVRKDFSFHYPFLGIEFYDQPHQAHQKSTPAHLISHTKTIGEIRKKHRLNEIEIYSWQKTREVEENFRKQLGLYVQIFRMQGTGWVQIVGSDEFTLDEQNETARNDSRNHFQDFQYNSEIRKPLE